MNFGHGGLDINTNHDDVSRRALLDRDATLVALSYYYTPENYKPLVYSEAWLSLAHGYDGLTIP
jgi:hypothetical protein